MNHDSYEIAAIANAGAYRALNGDEYIDGAPHVKHPSIRELYGRLVIEALNSVSSSGEELRVLDLGAGDGLATLSFLTLGCRVLATDLSSAQLAKLELLCERFNGRFKTECEDVFATLERIDDSFDVVVLNSFLHHVPDYMDLLRRARGKVRSGGVIFTFQDPLLYRSLPVHARAFSEAGYLWWRLGKGDLFGGVARRLRRMFGVYRDDSAHDNAEYHVTRGGVNQLAISDCFVSMGDDCKVVRYFSTQSGFFQSAGEKLGLANTFATIVRVNKPELD